jgi:ferredoxin-NADP reductase
MARHIALVVEQALEDGPLTRRLVLRDPDGWPLPRWKPGAHLDLMVPGIGPRAYSLCGDPATTDRWEVAVKREPASRGGSAWLHEALRPGDAVDATMPRCTFPIAANANRHVMVAGGIGVTPLLAMARALERQGADWALHLLCRGAPPCGEVLAALGPRAQVHDTVRAPRPAWDTLLGTPEPGLHAYCCGPEAMLVSGGQKARVDGGELRLRRPWRPGRGEDAVVLAAVQDAARRAKGAVACGHPGQPLRAPASGKAAGTEGWPWLNRTEG